MNINRIIMPMLLLAGCASNMQQYSANYKNNSIYNGWDEIGVKAANELVLNKDGTFNFTVMPFETYKDYWGTFSVDETKHIINFKIEGGNNVPKDAKLKNVKYAFDKEGHLILTNYYYGTVAKESKPGNTHIFKHY